MIYSAEYWVLWGVSEGHNQFLNVYGDPVPSPLRAKQFLSLVEAQSFREFFSSKPSVLSCKPLKLSFTCSLVDSA